MGKDAARLLATSFVRLNSCAADTCLRVVRILRCSSYLLIDELDARGRNYLSKT